MPAYNAEGTLQKTYEEITRDVIDEILLVDDNSNDNTVSIAKMLGIKVFLHNRNYGYGRNQMTCYKEAVKRGADIVIMIHPDYQYTPKLAGAMASMIAFGTYDLVLGSRIIGGGALKGGMPLYKYVANRLLTAFQNFLVGAKLSEFHTGYRAFSKEVLLSLPIAENRDGFIFDNEILVQALYFGYGIGEISCPTKYFEKASSINFFKSLIYGVGVIINSFKFRLQKMRVGRFRIFNPKGKRLCETYYEEIKGLRNRSCF